LEGLSVSIKVRRDLCKTSNFVEIAEGENLIRRNMLNISRT